jgi:hypothetical protein
MNKTLIASLLVAVSAVLAAPAFASGYGPAPSYRPLVGAPASQRGQSEQTVAAENAASRSNVTAYGGVESTVTQSGRRVAASDAPSLFSHH